ESPPPSSDTEFKEQFQVLFASTLDFLRRRYGNCQGLVHDTQVAGGALWSAYESLLRHQQQGDLGELPHEADYVKHFARITYNHWRRKDRRWERVTPASQLGAVH